MPLPSLLSKPVIAGCVAAGLLLAALVGSKLLPAGADDRGAGTPSPTKNPAPSRNSLDTSLPGTTYRKSSAQRSTVEKIDPNPAETASSRKEAMVAVSIRARRDLKTLRARSRNEIDSTEAREELAETLRNIADPAERKRLLEERAESMRIARDRADAEKGFPGRAQEKRLIALMQVQSLWRMNSHLAQNPSLQAEASQLDDKLAEWVENAESMNDEDFHKSFNDLRRNLNDLRIRNQAGAAGQP